MVSRYSFCALLLLFAFSFAAEAAIHQVPADYATIQAAIDASATHDTVLVSPGLYYENINFHGHNIVVASQYLLNQDSSAINATIINGSQPIHPDTASVVRIVSGEDSTAMLVGFTITGGTGTPLRDQDNQLVYVEGGGIMTDGSSPVIAHNYIVGNTATRMPVGVTSAGGGGIRVGFGHPQILNNVIKNNIGRYYGGGVVVNFASATLRNNVICGNSGGQTYGGGGLWMYGSAFPASVVENNTIVANNTTLNGGGVFVWSTSANLRNNIVWANHARTTGAQIDRNTSFGVTDYCDVQGGYAGTGNLDADPQFADTNLRLASGSPCINAGDSSAIYHDPDGSRNDMGACGGPGATALNFFSVPYLRLSTYLLDFGAATPGSPISRSISVTDSGTGGLRIDSARLAGSSGGTVSFMDIPSHLAPFERDTSYVTWTPTQNTAMNDTLLIWSSDTLTGHPARVILIGHMAEGVSPQDNRAMPEVFRLWQNYPNPFNPSTQIRFDLPARSQVRLEVFDVLGNRVTVPVNGTLSAGSHAITWNASTEPSGIYLCRLRAGEYTETRKMLLIK